MRQANQDRRRHCTVKKAKKVELLKISHSH